MSILEPLNIINSLLSCGINSPAEQRMVMLSFNKIVESHNEMVAELTKLRAENAELLAKLNVAEAEAPAAEPLEHIVVAEPNTPAKRKAKKS